MIMIVKTVIMSRIISKRPLSAQEITLKIGRKKRKDKYR